MPNNFTSPNFLASNYQFERNMVKTPFTYNEFKIMNPTRLPDNPVDIANRSELIARVNGWSPQQANVIPKMPDNIPTSPLQKTQPKQRTARTTGPSKFQTAFNQARNNRQKYFLYNGKMYNTKSSGNDTSWDQFDDNSYINEANGAQDVAFHKYKYGAPQLPESNQADYLRNGGWIRIK